VVVAVGTGVLLGNGVELGLYVMLGMITVALTKVVLISWMTPLFSKPHPLVIINRAKPRNTPAIILFVVFFFLRNSFIMDASILDFQL